MSVSTPCRSEPKYWRRQIGGIAMFIVLSLLFILAAPILALAQGPDGSAPSHEFWVRFNHVYDVGQNFLQDTVRGEGRVSAHNGAYTYRYEFPLPPGRNEMTPKLSLVYSSQAGRSYLGEGWSWTIPYIQRSTKFGVPAYTLEDQFDYYDESGSIHHLIPITETLTEVRYRVMSESNFAWFKYSKTEEFWTVLLKNGHQLEFGNPAFPFVARDYTPGRGSFAWKLNEQRDPMGNTIQYSYALGRLPSEIVYTSNVHKSEQEGWEPAVKVEFVYAWDSEGEQRRILNCRRGYCLYSDSHQLDRIEVSVLHYSGGYAVRKRFKLQYDMVDQHKVLSKIEPTASDQYGNWSSLPPVSFTYGSSLPQGSFATDTDYDDPEDTLCFPGIPANYYGWAPGSSYQSAETVELYQVGNVRGTATYVDTTIIDINGDGVKDFVRARQGGYDVYYGKTYPKQGNSSLFPMDFEIDPTQCEPDDPTQWRGCGHFWELEADCDDDPQLDGACPIRTSKDRIRSATFVSGEENPFPDEHLYFETTHVTQNLIDVNGDGLPDWIRKDGNSIQVALNNESGFDTPTSWDLPELAAFIDLRAQRGETGEDYAGTLVGFVDINGDGLPDIVSSAPWQELGHLDVYFNTGQGFVSTPHPWRSPFGTIDRQATFMWDSYSGFATNTIELADMNGDGLPDLVVQPGTEEHSPPSFASLAGEGMGPIQVYLNTGDGFEASPRSWELERPLSLTKVDRRPSANYPGPAELYPGYSGYAYLIDLNSDGLPDYLQRDESGENWLFYQNLGSRFGTEAYSIQASAHPGRFPFELARPSSTNHTSWGKFVDVNGDGRVDVVAAWPGLPGSESHDNLPSRCMPVKLSQYTPGLVLTQVDNGYGGTVRVEYSPSTVTQDSRLPASTQVVKAISTYDAFGQPAGSGHRIEYEYREGLLDNSHENYYHPANKEFRGFAQVHITDFERDLLTEQWYHQDEYRNGFLHRESFSRLSTTKQILRRTTSYVKKVIQSAPLWNSPSVLFYYPRISKTYICNEESDCTSTLFYRQYDADGNLRVVEDHGVYRRDGDIERGDETRSVSVYKSNVDLENNVYIWATNHTETYRVRDSTWIRDGLTRYYHDGSTDSDQVTQGLLTAVRIYPDSTTYYESTRDYDTQSGLLLSETDPNGNTTTYTYDHASNTFIATKTKGGLTEKFPKWDTATGTNLWYRDPNNVYWIRSYDGFGRLLAEGIGFEHTRKEMAYHDWEYQHSGRPAYVEETTTIDREASLYGRRRIYYNGVGNQIKEIQHHEGVQNVVRYFGYDAAERMNKVSEPMFRGETGWGYSYADWDRVEHTTIRHDSLDRVIEIRRTCSPGTGRTFAFDGSLRTTMVDEEGVRLSTLEDAHANITQVTRYAPIPNTPKYFPIISSFQYDRHNQISKATDPLGNEINYERDWLGRTTAVHLPGLAAGDAWLLDYDGNGNLIHSQSPADREIHYTYEALDRVVRREFVRNGNPDGKVDYEYDGPSQHYAQGLLDSASSAGGTARYRYDTRGNVVEYKTVNGVSDRTYRLQFTHNDADQIKTITYPDGAVFRYTYNPDGTAKSLIRESDGAVIATATYDARGQATAISTDFGLEYTYTYDTCGRPTGMSSSSEEGEIMNRSITYYANDKIRTIHDRDEVGPGEATEFEYDALIRLQSAVGQAYEAHYSYDTADRLTYRQRDGQRTDFFYRDARFPWAVTSTRDDSVTTGYTYDDDGIIIRASTAPNGLGTAQTTSFTFDARGLIKSATAGSFDWTAWTYDHQDSPVHKSTAVGRAWTDYVDKYYETQPERRRSVKYLFFAGRRIAEERSTGPIDALYYLHADQIGSIRYVTDTSGEISDAHYYYPYGEDYHIAGHAQSGFGFNGRRREGYGLYRFPVRMYNPAGHHWMSFDPAVVRNPFVLVLDGVNPYAYCGNDPINRIDPLGLDSFEWARDIASQILAFKAWFYDPRSGAMDTVADYGVGFVDSLTANWYSKAMQPFWTSVWGTFQWGAYKPTSRQEHNLGTLSPYEWGQTMGVLGFIGTLHESITYKEREKPEQRLKELETTLEAISKIVDEALSEYYDSESILEFEQCLDPPTEPEAE